MLGLQGIMGVMAPTLAGAAAAETWRGLTVAPEHRCCAYDGKRDYAYRSTRYVRRMEDDHRPVARDEFEWDVGQALRKARRLPPDKRAPGRRRELWRRVLGYRRGCAER